MDGGRRNILGVINYLVFRRMCTLYEDGDHTPDMDRMEFINGKCEFICLFYYASLFTCGGNGVIHCGTSCRYTWSLFYQSIPLLHDK